MENTSSELEKGSSELSGKLPAFISWVQLIGLAAFVVSRLFLKELDWLLYVSTSLIVSTYLLRMYFDWKQGRKKELRSRLIFLGVAIIFGLLLAYLSSNTR